MLWFTFLFCSWGPDDNGKTVDGPHQLAQVCSFSLLPTYIACITYIPYITYITYIPYITYIIYIPYIACTTYIPYITYITYEQ